MSPTDSDIETEADRAEDPSEPTEEQAPMFFDAATRVSKPSAFDDWYYGIEDKLGQGTIGMGVCLLVFIAILVVAMIFSPI